MKYFIFGIIFLFSFNAFAQNSGHLIIVKPKEIDDVLTNPGIGFTTFQMFNGDNHKPNQDVVREINLEQYNNPIDVRENKNYPETSIAYFRINWSVVETERGKYRWDYIDSLLELAHVHDQTLMLRISPYKGRPIDDVPAWYREMVGSEREFAHVKWPVDPENPLYAECFGNMIRALGNVTTAIPISRQLIWLLLAGPAKVVVPNCFRKKHGKR